MFDKPRRWRQEAMSATILRLLATTSIRQDRRQLRQMLENGQPHGLVKALVTSHQIKPAVEDLVRAGLVRRLPGIPLCLSDYLFTPPAFELTEKGRAALDTAELPTF